MHKNISGFTVFIMGALAMKPVMLPAADAPVYGPTPDWVEPQSAPATVPVASGPVQILLNDVQVNLAPGVSETYTENVVQVRTPQGLAAVGNIALSWQPETDLLTIHKLHIQRDGEVIDVLGSGQSFSVLRHEDGLEYAELSGALTAVIQPEGLQVGDRVELAYTVRYVDTVLGGVPEHFISVPSGAAVARSHLRARWPAGYDLTWQATEFLPGIKEIRKGSFTEISTVRDNDEPLLQPAGAPARFLALRMLQFSGHKSWADVSKLVFPLFESASRMSPSSPLRAEVARIRAAAQDPKERAAAALRLVQDQVRYVYLGMNDARIVPADIDTTWWRRYGDCKAKTVLLLALLRELDIDAEAVAVNGTAGDMLTSRLPMVGLFDHVLVRATIAGSTYWLDGTRSGDRRLDDLVVPVYRWGLPLRPAGAGLLSMDVVPPAFPTSETTIVVDASADPEGKVSIKAETLLRADEATATQQVISSLPDTQRDVALRAYWTRQPYWSNNWEELTVQSVEARYDDSLGLLRLSMQGEGVMNWQADMHLMGALSIGGVVDFQREPGPNSDAPYLAGFPAYVRTIQRIKLPRGGEGFSVQGTQVDRTIAGMSYRRSARIENGELVAEASVRSMDIEFPASEASAAQKALRELRNDLLYAVLPRKNQASWPANPLPECPAVADGQASGNAPALAATDLKVVSITPQPGTGVRRDEMLVVDLAYAARDFKPGEFSIIAQFDEKQPGRSTGGFFSGYPQVETPSGRLRICYPLSAIWDSQDVKQPFSVQFILLQKYDDQGRSIGVAMTDRVVFPTEDPPSQP